MSWEAIVPAGSAPPLAPYVPGTKAGNVVYTAGVVASDADGKPAYVDDARGQTRLVLETIRQVIDTAGGTMADITHNAIFIKDLDDYQAMNEVYREFFPGTPPARYCIRADLVRPEFLVEIQSIAHIE